ncbi:MAG: hypothetical protein ACKO2S_09220, partial [Burkholderiaceae bacterium]
LVGRRGLGQPGFSQLHQTKHDNQDRPGRRETEAAALVNGKQAAHLYEGRDTSGVITRNSIVEGLKNNARDRLGNFTSTLAKMDLSRM